MRTPRFIDFTRQLLERANHPDIAKIEPLNDSDTHLSPCGVVITMTDGTVVRLKGVRTSGPGGDDPNTEEIIPYPDYQIPENLLSAVRAE
ncbi:hypothetical protein ACIBF5_22695 [Micromonospora sp. NPDC050417]|uniref:hypothetical protein n=1 Tax=Micromonospora sp. NPDC050417 TaxID=3364280 RepID=UPI0037B7FC4B